MSGFRRSQRDVEGSACWIMRRAQGKEEAVLVHTAYRLLLAYYEEGCSIICKEMPRLPSASQPDPHSSTKFAKHGHYLALPHLGA